MGTIQKMLGIAMVLQATMDVSQENWKKEILEKWEASKKLPRKKKKKVRKELELDWKIASWNIFDETWNDGIRGVTKV